MANEMASCQSCNGTTTQPAQPDYTAILLLGFAATVGAIVLTKRGT